MRFSRIYQDTTLTEGDTISLDTKASHYVATVLRLKTSAPLIIFNGQGGQYLAEIIDINKTTTKILLKEFQEFSVESPLKIHLLQGISRGDKMDFTLQKAVELGVTEITPLFTERCGVKLDTKRLQKKMEHWQGIIISACEQCGRNYLPTLNMPITFKELLQQKFHDSAFILDPQANKSLAEIKNPLTNITLLIGPEGGLTDEEINSAKRIGMQGLQLGPRILRTETAALAMIASLQARFGDFY